MNNSAKSMSHLDWHFSADWHVWSDPRKVTKSFNRLFSKHGNLELYVIELVRLLKSLPTEKLTFVACSGDIFGRKFDNFFLVRISFHILGDAFDGMGIVIIVINPPGDTRISNRTCLWEGGGGTFSEILK